jgi:hypothetical protein
MSIVPMATAVTARLLVREHRGPEFVGVEVIPGVVDKRVRSGFQQTRNEALAHQCSLSVAAVGVEAVTDDRLAVTHDVGHYGDQTQRHLAEVDIGVADR